MAGHGREQIVSIRKRGIAKANAALNACDRCRLQGRVLRMFKAIEGYGAGFVRRAICVAALASLPGFAGAADETAQLRPSERPDALQRAVQDAALRAPKLSLRPQMRTDVIPVARWDHKAQSAQWTRAAMRALKSHGRPILQTVPRDIDAWCPAYRSADSTGRAAFWTGMMSALAKHESTYRPTAVGGGGRWYGLLQILPATARGYKCKATTPNALKQGPANLSCAVRIMATTVPRDGVVSQGMRGVAADWGPFHSRRKREDMRQWVRKQDYCRTLKSLRPKARPIAAVAAKPAARP